MFWRKINQQFRIFRGKFSEFQRESVQKNFLREQILHKRGNSNHFLNLGQKVSNFSPEVPSRAFRKAFYVTRGCSLGKKLLEVYSSLIFSDTEQKLSDFMRTVFCRIIKYAFYAPKGSFWENFLFEICAPHSRISSYKRCRFIAQNVLVRLSNLNPKVSRWSYFRKKLVGIFINFFIFGLWAVTFQTFDTKKGLVCRNCPLRFQRFLLSKIFSPEKIYLSVSDFLSWWFSCFWSKSSEGSLKLLSMCAEEFFEGKSFFELKSLFSISLWIWADDFQDSDEKCPNVSKANF